MDVSLGEAKITRGYDLPSKFVIHTIPPMWYDESIANKEEILKSCYNNIFEIASDYGVKTIAIPCIGTGKYKCPISISAEIAIEKAIKYSNYFNKIYLICYGEIEYNSYLKVFNLIKKEQNEDEEKLKK